MRVYLGTTIDQLGALGSSPTVPLAAGTVVHAATAGLLRWLELPAGLSDDDAADAAALAVTQLAGDDALGAIAERPEAPWRRAVACLEVPDASLVAPDDPALPPSALIARGPVRAVVVCAFVDEPEAQEDVEAAVFRADADAVERLADRDLLWYDVSELAAFAGPDED